jgi:A/G-specific adenine glycosylase
MGPLANCKVNEFRALVWNHYRRAGRHALPWRNTRDPYHIVVSEVMLQQTQVARVLSFYSKFIKAFPSFRALAEAPRREILRQWQGLGYNRRAVALQRLAVEIIRKNRGALPRDRAALERLPGIGPATAGSILAFAFNKPAPFLETNVRRAFIHHFFPKRRGVTERELKKLAAATLDRKNPRAWYYALMDYGSWLVKQVPNPNRRHARYRRQPKFSGSTRELRGKVLRELLGRPRLSPRALALKLREPLPRILRTLAALEKERLVT